jgi:hypothetical protein
MANNRFTTNRLHLKAIKLVEKLKIQKVRVQVQKEIFVTENLSHKKNLKQ